MKMTNAKKQKRDSWRKRRRSKLVRDLVLMSKVVCESHNKDAEREQEVLGRMLNVILDLTTSNTMSDTRREAFADHLRACAIGGRPQVGYDDDEGVNVLYVDGMFDVSELSKRICWADAVMQRHLELKGESVGESHSECGQ
jgi:hypothetical protein